VGAGRKKQDKKIEKKAEKKALKKGAKNGSKRKWVSPWGCRNQVLPTSTKGGIKRCSRCPCFASDAESC